MRCSVSVGGLNFGYWYTKTWPDFSELDLKFYLVFWSSSSKSIDPYAQRLSKPAEECSRSQTPLGMSEGRIMVDTLRDCYRLILIRDTIFEITCTLVDYFDSVVARLVSEPSCDVISVSILEFHWIQAIIASSLNIFVIIINCEMQVVDWVVRTCSSSARIWTIVQYPLLQSSVFPGSP